jgi:hypothetical protein
MHQAISYLNRLKKVQLNDLFSRRDSLFGQNDLGVRVQPNGHVLTAIRRKHSADVSEEVFVTVLLNRNH